MGLLRQPQFQFCRSGQPILSTVLLVSRIGGLVGRLPKKPGAVLTMARVARLAVVAVCLSLPQHPLHSTVTQDLQTGWQDGLWLKRLGVAPMQARDARQHPEGVLRSSAHMV